MDADRSLWHVRMALRMVKSALLELGKHLPVEQSQVGSELFQIDQLVDRLAERYAESEDGKI